VEEALLDSKLQNAFEAWLSDALVSARISVSEHLLAEALESGRPQPAEVVEEKMEELPQEMPENLDDQKEPGI